MYESRMFYSGFVTLAVNSNHIFNLLKYVLKIKNYSVKFLPYKDCSHGLNNITYVQSSIFFRDLKIFLLFLVR